MLPQLSRDVLARMPGHPVVKLAIGPDGRWWAHQVTGVRLREDARLQLARWVEEEIDLAYTSMGDPVPVWKDGATLRKHVALSYSLTPVERWA